MGKPNVVFVLGGPGAGKGTQCENIVKNFGYKHLSAGDLLRAERKKQNSEFKDLIEKHLIAGSIVPVEITCSLLEQAMNNHIAKDSSANRFLIDGFPRNEDNLDGWTRQMGEKAHVQFVLFFDCSDETCIQRCLARGEAGSGRSDDNIQSLKNRIVTYYESTMPIINRYEKQGLVRKVDAGRSVEEVFADVRKIFEAIKLS